MELFIMASLLIMRIGLGAGTSVLSFLAGSGCLCARASILTAHNNPKWPSHVGIELTSRPAPPGSERWLRGNWRNTRAQTAQAARCVEEVIVSVAGQRPATRRGK